MTTSKLPEWPDAAQNRRLTVEYLVYWRKTADAALARMEALVEYTLHRSDCLYDESEYNDGPWPCTCGLSDLLAACARSKS